MAGSCTKDEFTANSNIFLTGIKVNGDTIEKISYNKDNLVDEVNSTYVYRKFYYNDNLKLIREEGAVSAAGLLSSSIPVQSHEFIDPEKTGITYYYDFELNNKGYPIKTLNYFKINGVFELRSMRSFEYNENNQIMKAILHDRNGVVTQYYTYLYDKNGNVLEEKNYSYLLVAEGNAPKLTMTNTFKYDSYNNPFNVFSQTASPGINTNTNNIIKTISCNYIDTPASPKYSESGYVFEYNLRTGYPVRLKDGEEYIY